MLYLLASGTAEPLRSAPPAVIRTTLMPTPRQASTTHVRLPNPMVSNVAVTALSTAPRDPFGKVVKLLQFDARLVDGTPRFVPDPLREVVRLAAPLPRLVFPSRRFCFARLLLPPPIMG